MGARHKCEVFTQIPRVFLSLYLVKLWAVYLSVLEKDGEHPRIYIYLLEY